MDRLVLCGRIKNEDEDDTFCNNQSTFELLNCATKNNSELEKKNKTTKKNKPSISSNHEKTKTNNININNAYDDINQFQSLKSGPLSKENPTQVQSSKYVQKKKVKKEETCWSLFLDGDEEEEDEDEECFGEGLFCGKKKNFQLVSNYNPSCKNISCSHPHPPTYSHTHLHTYLSQHHHHHHKCIDNSNSSSAHFCNSTQRVLKSHTLQSQSHIPSNITFRGNNIEPNQHSNPSFIIENKNQQDCIYDNHFLNNSLPNKRDPHKKKQKRLSVTFLNNSEVSRKPKQEMEMGDERICYLNDLNDMFSTVRKIGSGTFGSVFLAICHKDQTKVALKVLVKEKTKIEDFCLEFRYSRWFSLHPGVVDTWPLAFVTKTWFILVQEYAPMSDLLRSVPPRVGLPEVSVKSVLRQVADALCFVHSNNVVHRDLKLENILIFQDSSSGNQMVTRVKLADFGVARKIGTIVCKACDGTTYTAPEICSLPKQSQYSVEVTADIWSLGVIVFSLLTGSFPWQMADVTQDPLFKNFVRWQKKQSDSVPEHWTRFTRPLARLFHRLLNLNPMKRSSISTISRFLDYPWMADRISNFRGSSSSLAQASLQHPSSLSTLSNLSSICPHHHPHHKHSDCHQINIIKLQESREKCCCQEHQPIHVMKDLYKHGPFINSGSLYSPLLQDNMINNTTFCGTQADRSKESKEDSTLLKRCQHCHDKLVKPCNYSDTNYNKEAKIEDQSKHEAEPNNQETKLRLDRVNMWLTKHMSFN